MSPATRHAIFFAPARESALWRFGSSVLGYDAATGEDVEQWVPPAISPADWQGLTGEPRRYGFHATLKAPFRLADGATEADVVEALARFAASATPLDLILEAAALDDFVALVPRSPPAVLAALERELVTSFDRFRAPLTAAERARRLRAPLTPRQLGLLDLYGYPYVLDEFRFHMTLTGRLPPALSSPVRDSLGADFAARCPAAVRVDRLALLREDEGRFRIVANIPFG